MNGLLGLPHTSKMLRPGVLAHNADGCRCQLCNAAFRQRTRLLNVAKLRPAESWLDVMKNS